MPRTEEQFQEIREKTKSQILNSSLKLFSGKGFSGTSISEIAKDAKISKGLIYNYFESKTAIVEALYQQLLDEMKFLMDAVAEIDDPSEKLQNIFSETLNYTLENKEYWKLYMGFILQPTPVKFEEILNAQFFHSLMKEFEKVFIQANVKNPTEEAYEFAAILDGMQMHVLFMEDLYPIDKMKEYYLNKYSKKELRKRRAK